jgi:tripeptide aminopeptidase
MAASSSVDNELIPLNTQRLLESFLEILRVDSYWGNEHRVVALIQPRLEAAGVICRQDAIGNLIGRWPANDKNSAPIMLNAHMDTVQPTPEMCPVVKPDAIYSDGSSVLGADDKAGVAAIVEAVATVHAAGLPHGPIDLVFTVGEEVGQFGADAFDPNDIEARVGLVLDGGGPVGEVVSQQAGSYSFTATFHGKAAHAGIEAADGISAIAMLARAIDHMPLGQIDELTVANVGVVSGGQAANIVPPEATLVGQARGLDQAVLDRQIATMQQAAEDAAAAFGGQVEIEKTCRFKATRFSPEHPAIQLADTAVRAAGLTPSHMPTFGGSDAQNFNEKGVQTAILGTGYRDMHSTDESIPRLQLEQLTQVTIQIIRNS